MILTFAAQKLPRSVSSKRTEKANSAFTARKRRKLDHAAEDPSSPPHSPAVMSFPRGIQTVEGPAVMVEESTVDVKNGESLKHLRRMTLGEIEHAGSHTQYVLINSVLCSHTLLSLSIDMQSLVSPSASHKLPQTGKICCA